MSSYYVLENILPSFRLGWEFSLNAEDELCEKRSRIRRSSFVGSIYYNYNFTSTWSCRGLNLLVQQFGHPMDKSVFYKSFLDLCCYFTETGNIDGLVWMHPNLESNRLESRAFTASGLTKRTPFFGRTYLNFVVIDLKSGKNKRNVLSETLIAPFDAIDVYYLFLYSTGIYNSFTHNMYIWLHYLNSNAVVVAMDIGSLHEI